jgi:hypothetical protein
MITIVTAQGLLWPSLVTIGPVVSEEKIDKVFPIGSYVKLSSTVARHDITEILLKMALSTITLTLFIYIMINFIS